MVKFGKPEATWKTREEENSCGRVGKGMVAQAEVREEEKGRATREVPREGHGWTEVLGRKNRKEIRDKETNIDNEKTSMAKKVEAEKRSERRRDKERGIVSVRIRIPTAIREKI